MSSLTSTASHKTYAEPMFHGHLQDKPAYMALSIAMWLDQHSQLSTYFKAYLFAYPSFPVFKMGREQKLF
jgi:hypothetical protein